MDVSQFGPEDLTDDLVAGILRRADAAMAHDHADPLSEQARLRLRHRAEAVHLVVGDRAYLQLADEQGVTQAEGFVAPDARRAGVAGALADRVAGTATGPVLAWAHGDAPGAARLADRVGAARSRELFTMARDASGVGTVEPPPGTRLRAFEPGRDEDEWLAVNAAAFATHPEQGRWTRRDLDERLAEPWFEPAGLILAQDDDGIAGFHWTKIIGDTGEVYVVGVAPRAQGRGLGGVLTRAGLQHMVERGVKRIDLYVDGDNTAAVHLYRSLGFEVAGVDVQYALNPGSRTL